MNHENAVLLIQLTQLITVVTDQNDGYDVIFTVTHFVSQAQ